jgi:lipopolysaccharide export system protein LptA
MTSKADNTQVRYEGHAVMWQGANRLSANRIDIDRPAQLLKANGQVVSQLLDRQASTKGQVFTIVRAPELIYSDKDQFAHYKGGNVLMTRPGLQVKGEEIRAYLSSNENSQSNWEGPNGGLEKAFADGKVEIVETKDIKSRQGWGDHAEYYVGEARLVLEGTRPRMVDLLAGVPQRTTEGKQMVWFANNDRLIVDGEENRRAISNLRKK